MVSKNNYPYHQKKISKIISGKSKKNPFKINKKKVKKVEENFENAKNNEMEIDSDVDESPKNSFEMNFENENENTRYNEINSYNKNDNSFEDNYSTANSNIDIEKKNEQNDAKVNMDYNDSNIKAFENAKSDIICKGNFIIGGLETKIRKEEENIDEIFINLIHEEKKNKYPINPNYLDYQPEINNRMRIILIDWIVEIHYKLRLKEETFYTTIYIIDAYLSQKIITKNNFQLLGITSLLIASKLNEMNVERIQNYSFFAGNAYNKEEIINMELDISKTLDYNFLITTPIHLFQLIGIKFSLKEDEYKYKFGEFLIQSFLMSSKSFKYKNSIISYSSLYLLMKLFKLKNSLVQLFNWINEFSVNDYEIIKKCSNDICQVISEIINSNIKSTIKKYFCEKFIDDVNKLILIYECENI